MAWLPDGENFISKISLFVLTQLTNLTGDRHTYAYTDRQTPHNGIGRAYASHRAAKTRVPGFSDTIDYTSIAEMRDKKTDVLSTGNKQEKRVSTL